ncbi:hypothetical protein ACFZBC_18165 [Streptomyces luteogriseus]|uniref:hypothetical protein n=1 Tax=Streptomyces luteogriseus TaxID=68233 RepID=UPI0036EA693E
MVDMKRIRAETLAYFRSLDENATLRHHFRHADEEGGLWYIEVVPDRGELIVIKQAELTSAGRLHRYSWEHLEDEHGGLTDQAIDPVRIRWRPSRPRSSRGCGRGDHTGQPLQERGWGVVPVPWGFDAGEMPQQLDR